MTLTANQVREFNDRGFLILKGFFDKAAIGKISAWLDEMQRRPQPEGPEAWASYPPNNPQQARDSDAYRV